MSDFSTLLEAARVILYHKHPTSAMTRFFKLEQGVLVGRLLPQLARVVTDEGVSPAAVVPHPGAIAAELEQWLSMPAGSLEVDADYAELVEVPGAVVRIFLIRFTTIDPPFDAAAAVNAAFVPLTQTRGLPQVELELLRSAYVAIMEG